MEHLLKQGAKADIQYKSRGALTYIGPVTAEEIQAGVFGRPLPVQQLQKTYMLLNSNLGKECIEDALFLHHAVVFKNGKSQNECNQKELISLMEALIEKWKGNVNQENSYCETPLHSAVEAGNLQAVAFLIKHHARVNHTNEYGNTLLHTVMFVQDNNTAVDIVEVLVKAGANSDDVNNRGVAATVCIIRKLNAGNLGSLANRRDLGKIVNSTHFLPRPNLHCFLQDITGDKSISSLLHHTSKQNDLVSKLNVLHKARCNFDVSDIHHRNLLHWASWLKCPNVLGFLTQHAIKNKRIIKDKDSFGRNCFHFAASLTMVKCSEKKYCWDSEDLYEALFEELSKYMKKDINCQDRCGRTALHHAVSDNNGPGVKALLKYGASVSLADSKGYSPEDYACQLGHFDLHKTMAEFSKIQSPMFMKGQKTLAFDVMTLPSEIEPQEVDGWIQRATICYGKKYDLIKTLRSDSLTKPVVKSESESRIIDEMLLLAKKLSTRIAEIDPLYSSNIQLAGSVSEGTKIGTMNEFDVQFHFHLFGSDSIATDSGEEDRRVIILKTVAEIESRESEFYLEETGEMNQKMFFQRFVCLAMKAVSTGDVFEGGNFQLRHHQHLFQVHSFVEPLCLLWGGPGFAAVPVNVDLVPIIQAERVCRSIRDQVPLKVQQHLDNVGWTTVIMRLKNHVTFHDTEVYIMRSLLPELKEAYMMAKGIMKLCPDIHRMGHAGDLSSYMLKNALFHELDPFLTYSLLERQVCLWTEPQVHHKPTFDRAHKEVFIHHWAMKIFDKLESMIQSEMLMCYCQPSREIASVQNLMGGNECNAVILFCKICQSLLGDKS